MEKIVINLEADLKKMIKIDAVHSTISTKRLLIGLYLLYHNSSEESKASLLKKAMEYEIK